MSWPKWNELLDLWDVTDPCELLSQLTHGSTSLSSSLIQLLEATNVLLSGCPQGPMPADICEAAVASGASVLLVRLACGLSSICLNNQQSTAKGLLNALWTHAVSVLESISKAASLSQTGPAKYLRQFSQAPSKSKTMQLDPIYWTHAALAPVTLNHLQMIFALHFTCRTHIQCTAVIKSSILASTSLNGVNMYLAVTAGSLAP